MFMHSATDAAWIAASNHQQTLLSAHRNFSSKSPIQQGTGSLARFKSNAPLTMCASWEDIFCLLSYESSRYQFPLLAKDRSVVPLVRSSDPFFSEPELHYQPFNVTFKCERMQLSAVWFGRSVCAVISIGGLRPVASGSLAFCLKRVGVIHIKWEAVWSILPSLVVDQWPLDKNPVTRHILSCHCPLDCLQRHTLGLTADSQMNWHLRKRPLSSPPWRFSGLSPHLILLFNSKRSTCRVESKLPCDRSSRRDLGAEWIFE